MLKNSLKVTIGLVGILATSVTAVSFLSSGSDVSADASNDLTFQVNVEESLSVSITTPSQWASGDINDLLRNKVNVSVVSNNAQGFHASMYANSTSLVNSANSTYTLPTLTISDWDRSSTVTNFWGYSLDAASEASETPNGTYHPMTTSSSPISILDRTTAASGSQDIYFGAQTDITKAAGTYTGTVVINVVTGNIDTNTNPAVPTNPATPTTADTAVYSGAGTKGVGSSTDTSGVAYSGTTTYTSVTTSDGNTTTTTQVTGGDNTSAYSSPQGVSTISNGSSLATGLAATAAVAAISGVAFFVVAKHKEDDEDEEEY